MARYMGKGYEEIWKSVMGSEKMPGQSGQAASREESKTKSSGGKYSGMSSEEIWDSVMAKSETPGWKAYQGWLGDYSNVATKYRDYSKRNTGKWQADAFGGTKDAMDSLLGRYDEIYSGLEDDYDKWMFRKDYNGLKKTYDYLQEANKFYSQFRDGDDYDRTRSGYGNYGVGYNAESYGLKEQDARELRRQAYEKDKAAYNAGYGDAEAAVKALQQERRVAESRARLGDGKYNDLYFQDLERREQEAKDALNRNALVYKDRMDAYEATWGKIDRYTDTMEQAKGTKGSYTGPGFQEAMDWQQRQWERATGSQPGITSPSGPSDALEIGDKLGFWLSLTPEQQGQEAVVHGSGKHWENLREEEISTYYYLQQQQGQGAADQYLEDMQSELNRRADAKTIQQLQNTSGWGLVGKNAESVAANLVGSIPAAIGKAEELVTGKHDPYSGSSAWRRYASYIRGVTGERVEDWTKRELHFNDTAATFANNIYQAVMSGVDSAAGAALFGAGAGVPVGRFTMHVGGYTTVMGLGAFADRAQELQLKGASAEQIALGAVGSGVLEALFEDISLESYVTNILENPATTLREFGKKLAVQMGVEASEEVFTEIGNMMWDAIVMGQSSDTQQAIRKYMEQGMDQDHARAQAIKDNALDIFWAGFGGAISAGAMSVTGQMAAGAARSAQETAGNFEVGRNIVYNGQVRDLEGQAQQLQDARKSEKLMKLARKAAGLYDQGEQGIGTAYKAGKVATGIAREAGREAARAKGTEFRAAAEAYLAGREDITDKKRALNVLSRVYNKDTQLPGDQAAYRKLGGEKTVKAILDSVGGTESFQARVDQRRAASMRTAAGVQNSVLGVQSNDTGSIEYQSGGDGTALRKGTAEPVQITGIADTKGGLMLKTGDGDTVLAKDIVAGSRGEAAVLNAIDFMETNPYTAQALWEASRVSALDGVDFAKGIKDAYLQGRVGTPYESIQPYSYAARLTDAQRKTAWTEGRTALEQYTKAQAEKVNSGAMKAAQKGVTVLESAQNVKSLNKQQKSAMAAANALAAVGLHIEVYASTPEDRAKGMPNGTYRKSDGGIAVDLNAGDGGQGAMAYALAHETTHFIKDFSAEKYKSYADLLIAEAQRQGIRYDSVFAREYDRVARMDEYKGLDEKQLHDIAYDETIAEMSEMMLTDTDAIGRIAGKLKNQDKGLWEKIKDFFTGLVEKLRNAYQDAEPDSEIAKILKRAIQDNEALAEAWASAVVDAGENYQLQDGQKKNAREGVTETGVRYSTRNLSNQIDEVANQTFDTKNHVNYGSTPKALSNILSLPILPMLGTYTHAYTMALSQQQAQAEGRRTKGLNFHELGWDTVKNIPDMLNHPAAIIKSNTDVNDSRFVVVTKQLDKGGNPIIAAIAPKGTGRFYSLDMTGAVLLSGYGKDSFSNYLNRAQTENRILWVEKNNHQKQASPGVQFPNALLSGDYTDNLAQFKQIVKREFQGTIFQNTFDDDGNRLFSSRNTRDSDGNQLTEDQARYFENSRVRDDEGNLKVVYHGSPAIFTEFSADFMGTHGSSEGQGFYFTDYKPMAEGYRKDGGQLLQGYLNIQKPLSDSEVTLKRTEVRKLLHALDPTGDDLVLNYDSMGGMGYPSKAWYNRSVNDTLDAVMNNDSDSEILGELANAMGNYGAVLEKARDVLGYDGYIVSGKYDDATVYVAFDSSQFKNADNQKPTSAKDIRFSQRVREGDQVERLAKQNEVLEKEVEYLKELVNIQKRGNKDHILDRNSVNKQGKVLMDSVNAKGNITEFNRMLNDLYREISTVEMDYDTLKEKAGVLADWLLDHHQAEKDSYAQEILDFLAKRRVRLNEGQTGDIEYSYGSLNDFKKAIKGSVIIDPNANTSLDQLWQGAAARFPDRFDAETVDADMPDGLAEIVEWANSSESQGEAQWQYYRAENRNDLIEQVLLGYWEAEPIQSVADKSRAEIAKLRQEHREAMKEARKEKRQAVTDERARSNAAIEAYRAQRDIVDTVMMKVYSEQRNQVEQAYASEMKRLRKSYSEDTKLYQEEFFRMMKDKSFQEAHSPSLRKMLNEMAKAKSDGNKDAEQARRQVYASLREQYEQGKNIQELEAKVKKQREAAKAKVESRRRTEERAKIQKTLDTLNRYLLHPTDTVHVPQALQSSVAAALEAANNMILNSKAESNAKRLADYAALMQKLEEQPEANSEKIKDLNRKIQNLTRQDAGMKNAIGELLSKYNSLKGETLWDENIEGMIKECYQAVGDTAYRDLNLEQLKTVKDTYRALLTTIQNANKTFVAERNAGILDLVNRTRRELEAKPLKNTRQSGIGETYDKFSWNNEKPIYAFERIGSATLSELYRNLRAGEDTWARDVSEAKAFFTGSAARHGYDKWKFGTLETFTASDGTTFQLDLDERMSVYAYSLREQAREHLLQGGITLSANTQREVKGPLGWSRGVKLNDATAYALTTETLQAIADSLTPEQRAFAREMQQYLSTVMGAKGNEVSMALYGIKKYNERNYWPIKSSDRFSEVVRTSQEQVGKLKNKGMTKSTVEHANNPIEISGFIDTWGNHVSDMSMYHAFVLPMEDFSKVYNWHQTGDGKGQQSVGIRQLIEQTHGKGAVSYIDTFMKDLNGGIKADPRADVTRKMLSSFKKAAVTASLSVAIQQPSAVGRAFAYIEANYFVGEKVSGVRGTKETWEQMKKYAPGVVVVKDMGRFSMDMGMSVQDYIMGKDSVGTWEKVINKVDDVSGLLPEYADKVTWCAIWEAAKRKTAAMNPGLKGDALLYKAGELFSDTIQKTQVYDSVFSRSANMRSKDLLSAMTTSFMAEPTTTANMVGAAVRKLVKGDKRMSAKMLSAVATATVLNAVLASFVYAMRDKDQDKTYWEKYVSSLTAEMIDSFNPLTYVPILNDINSLLAGYSVNRTDLSLASDAIDTIKGLYTTYKRFDPDWDEERKKEWEKKIRDGWFNTTLSMGNFLGLPLKNIYRDVSGMVNTWTNPSRKAEMSVDTVLEAMRSSAKQNLLFISWTADESNSDQLYEAITAGKTVLAKRVKGRFKDQAAYENAIRKGLRDNDPRIHQAAEYVLSMETEKRVRLIRDIVAEGHFDQDTVIKAINAEANSMKEKTPSDKEAKPEKLYSAEEYVNAQSKGLGYAQEIQKGIVQYNLDRIREEDPKLSRERAEDKAKERFQSAVRSETKIAYQDGDLDDSKARKVLLAAEAESEDSVEDKLLAWKTDAELGFEYDWEESKFRQYAKYIKPSGISADIFDTFIKEQNYIQGEDLNGDGENDPYTTVANKAKYINSLPLTAAQKETLWESITYRNSKKTRAKYRLW
nr:MAG TPA: chromosome segregation ATPase [Caudoviricetes sp.]